MWKLFWQRKTKYSCNAHRLHLKASHQYLTVAAEVPATVPLIFELPLVSLVSITLLLVSLSQLWRAWQRAAGSDPRRQGWSVNPLARHETPLSRRSRHITLAARCVVWLWCRCNSTRVNWFPVKPRRAWSPCWSSSSLGFVWLVRGLCGFRRDVKEWSQGLAWVLGWNLRAGCRPEEL